MPIVLATYAYASGSPHANTIFNIVFFMVLISITAQGMSIGAAAKRLGVILEEPRTAAPQPVSSDFDMRALCRHTLHFGSKLIGKNLAELELPREFLVILIKRKNEYLKPSGSFVFEEGDLLLVSCENQALYKETIKNFTD